MIPYRELQDIIQLVCRSPIQNFHYSDDTSKILIEKTGPTAKVAQEDVEHENCPSQLEALTPERSNDPAADDKAKEKKNDTDFLEIVSPMVGTFYSSSEQDAPPLVNIGDKVHPDSVVCVLEAMKMFSEVPSTVSGEIVEILVQDGQLVEYGQPLFRVKSL
ncbi:acetyl-CoA carboxylase biotin carboxyl carrier protein [Melghirimyces algeriensis]|uniref:Biotin carboxyl carrier protein of acetyl-CoA carboxylase n=1 Tax=Melghirimyces algeriensis TaxID=910412 RepID=A0A521BFI9_9BACL|nr:acetyl-CoA carboxylase biotin carboxyl carrier protein [Melghirimyces algeriensis]SMO45843.1 biotin carboxyl carrier protein [Melghirimyces algeriensis]